MLRVTKEFSFEAAHRLDGYNGKCANIHGHSYRLVVSVKGSPIADPQRPDFGMVIDFTELKRIVEQEIIAEFDHALVLRSDTPMCRKLQGNGIRIVATDYQPTCENLLLDIVKRLQVKLPDRVCLHNVKLYETATSYAEYSVE